MIFLITNFSGGSHWDAAIIEASNKNHAIAILRNALRKSLTDPEYEDGYIETIVSMTPSIEWRVEELESPIKFVLGQGCRSTGSLNDTEAKQALGILKPREST